MIMQREKLVEELLKHRGATPVSLIAVTVEKDVNGQEFIKVNKINGMIGFDYQNSINNAQEKQGEDRDFVCQSRKWGKHMVVDGKPLAHMIEHTGKDGVYKRYLQVKVQTTGKPLYIDSKGRVCGKIEKKQRKEYKAESLGVILRDYNLDGIKAINWKGQRIKVA